MISLFCFKNRDYVSLISTLLLVVLVFAFVLKGKPMISDVIKKDHIVKLSLVVPQPPKPQPPQPPKPQPPKPQPPKPQPPKPQPPKPQPPKPQPPKPQPPKPHPPKPQPPKPQPPKPQPPKPQPQPPQPLVASKATARPADPLLQAKFLKMLLIRVTRNKHYPPRAEKFGITGNVIVEYNLKRNGAVLSVTISRSSGNKMLDQAALKAVRTAHFDAWPDKLFSSQESKTFSVKIEYNIDE